MKARIAREPVVKAFVLAAAALTASFGYEFDAAWLETATNWGSIAYTVAAMLKARSRVTPVEGRAASWS